MSLSLALPALDTAVPILLDAAAKSVVVLALAGGAALAMRRASAAARHLVWSLAMAGLLVLPILSAVLPAWRVLPAWLDVGPAAAPDTAALPHPAARPAEPAIASAPRTVRESPAAPLEGVPATLQGDADAGAGFEPASRAPMLAAGPSRAGRGAGWASWGLAVWAIGALVALAPLVAGRIWLWWLLRAIPRSANASQCAMVREASACLGLTRQVLVLESRRPTMPMVWGIVSPKLLLPSGCWAWPRPRLRSALLHELAHVKRLDCLTKLVGQVACALYWVNPLVWVAQRRLRAEAELACDDMALRAWGQASDYAQHLLEIASGHTVGLFAAQSGIAMARPSKLEGRLRAILSDRRRGTVTRIAVAAAIVVVVSLITLVAVVRTPGPRAAAEAPPARTDPDALVVGKGPVEREPDWLLVPGKGPVERQPDRLLVPGKGPVEREPDPRPWGPPLDGVRCRLEADKPVWRVGETPRLKATIHHEGDAKLWLALHVGFGCQLDVDGHRYRWCGPWDWSGPSVNPSTRWKDKPFPISLDRDWQKVSDKAPLKLAPGKHTIRFAWAGSRGPEGRSAEGEDARILLMSNPVHIEIVADDEAWGEAVEGVQVRLRAEKKVWQEGETPKFEADVRNQGERNLALVLDAAYWQIELDSVWYHSTFVHRGTIGVMSFGPGRRYSPATVARFLANPMWKWRSDEGGKPLTFTPGKHIVRVAFRARATKRAGGKDVRAVSNPVEIEIMPAKPRPAAKDAGPAWGKPVEGVQVRLRAEKKVWQEGETPRFEADVRNQGERDLDLVLSAEYWRIELDSVWYHSTFVHLATIGVMPFGPGHQYSPTTVARFLANPMWKWRSDEGDKPLTYTPGKHIVRVAFRARATERAGGKDVRAVSNPVEIEIRPAAADEDDGEVAFAGRVVDAQTGQAVERFGWQWGWPDPRDPAKVGWGGMTTHPGRRRGGRFHTRTGIERGRRAWVRILADGYLPEPVTPEPVAAPSRLLDLVVRLRRGGEIRGRVLDHAGEPVAGAKVFLAGHQYIDLIDGNAKGFGGSRAVTDHDGRFVLRGAGGKANRVVVSAPSLHVWNVAAPAPQQELTIRLPEPATLVLRYDIAGGEPVARFHFRLRAWEMEGWRQVVDSTQNPTVPNQGETVLRNVTPGVYNLARWKNVRAGDFGKGLLCDRQTVTLKPGETTKIDFVRKTGHPIVGRITGRLDGAAACAFVRVESAQVHAGAHNPEGWATIFDAVTCELSGRFKTARIPIGAYTLVAEAYRPAKDTGTMRTGIRLPDFVGTAKVTVTADGPPPQVTIQMKPRAE